MVCLWCLVGRKGVVQTWGYTLNLLFLVLKVDIFPLLVNSQILPLLVAFGVIKMHAVSVQIMG